MASFEQKSLFGEPVEQEVKSSHVIRVAFDAGVDNCFDYAVPDSLWPVGLGQRVLVPFGRGNKPVQGFCVAVDPEQKQKAGKRKFKLKAVQEVVDEFPLLDNNQLALAKWISDYYVSPLGQVISAMVPAAVKKGAGMQSHYYIYLAKDREGYEETKAKLRKGSKQKEIIEMLEGDGAVDEETAFEQSVVLDMAETSSAVIKGLLQKGLIIRESRTVLRSLPAIPPGLAIESKEVILNKEQVAALAWVCNEITESRFGVSLLHGVTDSGKTEVYIRAIQHAIDNGKRAIILLPEIALTTQTIQRFSSRFDKLAVMHSGLTPPQRNDQWQKIASGEADVIIGARSAIFAPVKNLGIVVVDEEHEPSYKQDTVPRYHGRDVAIKRAHLENAHCLLGSATPSLETLLNCDTKQFFKKLDLPNRVNDLPMPAMEYVDLSYEPGGPFEHLISSKLEDSVNESLEKGEQIILLLNRRGFSNFIFCPSCKHTMQCRNCDVSLTFHKSKGLGSAGVDRYNTRGKAVCHYCGAQTLVPDRCPLCQSKFTMVGLGAQRLEEEIARKFKDARLARVDSDSMKASDYYNVLRDFSQGDVDILAGTQMLAKGLHFPNVTLVGVVSADTSLAIPDFRANERTFQLLSQVAGRTGRGEKPGKVIIQTMMPSQPAIKYALAHDFKGFSEAEMDIREKCSLPPYWRMAIIGLRDENFERLEKACQQMDILVGNIITSQNFNIKTRGPMPSTIARMHGYHRMQIILQAPTAVELTKFFGILRAQPPIKPSVTVVYDVDPVNLL